MFSTTGNTTRRKHNSYLLLFSLLVGAVVVLLLVRGEHVEVMNKTDNDRRLRIFNGGLRRWFHFGRTSVQRCNGHANLCNKPANEVLYATMHNANNAILDGATILPNHVLDIKAALKKGYRGINFDVAKCLDKVTLIHSSCVLQTKQSLVSTLKEIVNFLDDNPNEVLILPTEFTSGGFLFTPVSIAEVDAVFQEVPGWNDKLYDHTPGNAWPTLQQLIEMDKRILFFFYGGADTCVKGVDCPVGWHPWFDFAVETQFSFLLPKDLDNKTRACEITRGMDGTQDFFGVNLFVTPASRPGTTSIIHKADYIRTHLQACQDLNGGLQPNALLVDFLSIGDVIMVTNEINAAL